MANKELTEKKHPNPVVTESKRKRHAGFVNPNKGIEVAAGLNMQDVPRDMIVRHMRETENFWKTRFGQQYGSSYGGSQSF